MARKFIVNGEHIKFLSFISYF